MIGLSKVRSRTPLNRTTFGPAQLRRVRLLNGLLFMMGIGTSLVIVISQANAFPNLNFTLLWPQLGGLAVVGLCYLLNRQGLTYLAASILFLAANLLLAYYLGSLSNRTIQSNLRGATPILIVPVVAAGVIIGPAYSFIFAGVSTILVGLIGFSRAGPGVPGLESSADVLTHLSVPVCLLFVMAGLSWFFENNIQSLVNQLTGQNQKLDSANRELARRHEIEQQLSKRVDELTSQLSASFAAQNSNTATQIEAIHRANRRVDELGQLNRAILEVANEVDRTAQHALQVAQEGTNDLRSGLTSLNSLSEQAHQTASAMRNLYNQARQIDSILELITQITDETDLLALNATIEAAGAGVYGRRFASVANEVQRLANRSREATGQVQGVVEEVQKAIEAAARTAQAGVGEAARAMSGSRTMSQSLEDIMQMVQSTASLAERIVDAVQRQRGSTVEMVEEMGQISAISHSLTQGGREVLQGLDALNEAVVRLNSVS